MTLDDILLKSESILESDLGQEKVMMSLDKGQYFGLSKVGSRIYDLCDGQRSLREIADQIQSEFEVTADECEQAVIGFAQTLVGHEIVRQKS